jgi:chemotaxis protein CheZ
MSESVEAPTSHPSPGGVVLSRRGYYAMIEVKVYDELERLAEIIRSARREIAELRPDEINSRHIPQATDELDAVVRATEDATGSILDAVEAIEGVAGGLAPEQRGILQESVTRIYEACNFQDVTGQRVTKVINTMKRIEAGVSGLLAALGEQAGEPGRLPPPADAAPAGDPDAALLHGPQLPEVAQNQADIDALFASL